MSKQLSAEELQEFKGYRLEANRLAAILGELHYQRTLVDLELEGIKRAVGENSKKQQVQLRALGEKYGDGTINVETGEIVGSSSN